MHRTYKKAIQDLTNKELAQMYCLLKPYYVNPKGIFHRAVEHNSHAYLVSNREKIESFFLVGWDEKVEGLNDSKVIYLGLSCTDIRVREKNIASRTFIYFTSEAYQYEQRHNTQLILYCTTATPVVLRVLPKIWSSVRPGWDGAYKAEDRHIIEQIKTSRGWNEYSTQHPFVLHGQARNTKYSETEERRLKQVEEKYRITLFQELGIRESRGDRLLILCAVPSREKIEALKSSYSGLNHQNS